MKATLEGSPGQRISAANGVAVANDQAPLLHLTADDPLTVKQSFEGVFVTGQTGSGKSSGPGQALALAMLRSHYGFLVTTTKPDDARTFVRWARQAGREKDVRLFGPDQPWRFGLLDYAYHQGGTRGGGQTENVVELLAEFLEFKNKARQTGGDHQFWLNSAKKMLGHFVDLLAAAGETVSFAGINKILQSLPLSVDEVKSREWQEKSFANLCVDKATANPNLSRIQQNDLALALESVLAGVPRMEERLRSGITATLDSITYPFLRGHLAELCGGKTTILPEDTFRGAVNILSIPVKEFGEAARFIQVLVKRLWEQAAEKRDLRQYPRPLCLFCDEAQNFCTRYEPLFQATARSARVCSVFLTQNLDSLHAQIGKAETEALLGNFNTKIFCSSDHVPTNEWAAKMIGQEWGLTGNTNVSLGGEGGMAGGVSEQRRYLVEPSEFAKLRKGGEDNGNPQVECLCFHSGRPFRASDTNHVRVLFPQNYEMDGA